jgi:hypothetical protein
MQFRSYIVQQVFYICISLQVSCYIPKELLLCADVIFERQLYLISDLLR